MKLLTLFLLFLGLSSCGSGGGSDAAQKPADNIRIEVTADQANITCDVDFAVLSNSSLSKYSGTKTVNDQTTYTMNAYSNVQASVSVSKYSAAGTLYIKVYKDGVKICDSNLTASNSSYNCTLN